MTPFHEPTTLNMIFSGRYLGLLILALTLALFFANLLAFVIAKSRRPFVILLMLAFVPLALGLITSLYWNCPVRVVSTGRLTKAVLANGSWAGNRIMPFMGLASTVPLALLALLGMAIKKGRSKETPSLDVHPAHTVAPREPGVSRREILERLARKEITQEEAERLMDQAGEPIPGTPPPVPPQRSTGGRGCLIALLIALAVIVLLAALLFFAAFFLYPSVQRMPARRMISVPTPRWSQRGTPPILDGTAVPLLPVPDKRFENCETN